MTPKPIITIIIPAKGRLEFTRQALDSVYSQVDINPESLQVIVVEDHPEFILRPHLESRFPLAQFYLNTQPTGPSGGRNTGLAKTKGRYVVFLDSDDILKPNYLIKMLSSLQENAKSSAVVCFSETFFEPGYTLISKIRLFPLMLIRDSILNLSFRFNHHLLPDSAFYLCQTSHLMFRSTVAKKIKFNTNYKHGGEEWDYIARALTYGSIFILPEKLLLFRQSPQSFSRQKINEKYKWKNYRKLIKHLPSKIRKGFFTKLFQAYQGVFNQ